MEDNENFDQFYFKLSDIVNSSFNLGEQISSSKIVQKILRSLPERFQAKVTAIEESRDVDSMRVEDLVGSLQTFEANFRQPQRNKSIAFNSIKDSVNEASDSDSEMSPEDMAILVKKFKKFFKKKQEGQSSSVDKNKGKYFDKTKFVRKSSDKSSKK